MFIFEVKWSIDGAVTRQFFSDLDEAVEYLDSIKKQDEPNEWEAPNRAPLIYELNQFEFERNLRCGVQ